ncbi:MAG: rod shape-determining protein RodA [Neisseriaceae bacterium]|nr:rod shape-determining protein RodA [Neisseriaceae bacterium]
MSNNPNLINRFINFVLKPLDKWLIIDMMIIYVMSLFLLYSADGQDFGQLGRKAVYTVLGLIVMWILAKSRPQFLSNFALPMYVVGLLLLLGVHLFGITVNGSTRWINLGVRIQPSEIMKIALPMLLAWYFQRHENILRWYHYVIALILIALPVFFILKQPDLGTAILISASGLFVIFFAGLPWKVIFGAIFAGIISVPLLWQYGLHDYQRQRILTLFNPEQDRLGAGYHILQSITAIGSGGFWGKGWLGGSQTHLAYIPESTTDFIFAVFSEEFGFIGNCILLILYGIMIARGLFIAARAQTLYGQLLAAALTMTIFCYAFVNMGMVSGILPVVGVPLPLVSYGGTATLSIMVILGMLMGISSHIDKYR